MTRIKHDRSADGIVTPYKSAPLEKVLTWRQSLGAERMQQEDTFLGNRLEDCLNNSMSTSGMVGIPRLEAKISFRNGRLILERSRP
jgi:hypothetical protein